MDMKYRVSDTVLDNLESEINVKYFKMNWISIKKKSDCLFSRRNGYVGKLIFGYSIRLRLFGKDII